MEKTTRAIFWLLPKGILEAYFSICSSRKTTYQMTREESQELVFALLNVPLSEWKLEGSLIYGWGGDGRAFTLYRKALIKIERICERGYLQDNLEAYYNLWLKNFRLTAISSVKEGFGGIEEKLYEHIVQLRRKEIDQLKEQKRGRLQEKFKNSINYG